MRVVTSRLHRRTRELQNANRRTDLLRRELDARAEQQAAVARLGTIALQARDAGPLMDEAATAVGRVLDVELAGICELNAASDLEVRAVYGWPPDEVEGLTLDGGPATHSGYAVATGEPVVFSDVAEETRFRIHPMLLRHGVTSGIALPIPGTDRPFGALCAHSTRVRQFTSGDVNFLQAVAHIVAEAMLREQSDEVIRRTERLESLGRLAGGVAHDFNNLLGIIVGNVALIRRFVEDERVLDFVDEVRVACDRAKTLTRQLLTFARKSDEPAERFDVTETLRELEGLILRAAGTSVVVSFQIDGEGLEIVGERSVVEQILLNLAVNARDAMPDGGSLVVRAEARDVDDEYALRHPKAAISPGRYVAIAVADTGTGMSEEVRSRVFEPFFTTKPRGVGTGLGLATVYGAARQLGGDVEISSEEGRGTEVVVLLPLAQQRPAVQVQQVQAGASGPRVLVVDDDDGLRKTICDVLERSGYEPVQAGDVPEGLTALADREHPVDVLLVDLVLPGTSGWVFVERARSERPDLPVVLMSGYAVVGLERPVPGPQVVFLRKPFGKEELTAALSAAAKASPAAAS